jgi:hypothetical protein
MIIPAVETARVRGVSFMVEFDRMQMRIRSRMNVFYFVGLLFIPAFAMLFIFGIAWLIWGKIHQAAVSGAINGSIAPVVMWLITDRQWRRIIRLHDGRISLDRQNSALWDSTMRRVSPKHSSAGEMRVRDAGPAETARVVVRRFAIWYAVCIQPTDVRNPLQGRSADARNPLQGMIWHCLLRSDAEKLEGVIREFLHPYPDGTTWPPPPVAPEGATSPPAPASPEAGPS